MRYCVVTKYKTIKHLADYIGIDPDRGLAYIIHDFLGCYVSGAVKSDAFNEAKDSMTYPNPKAFYTPYQVTSIRDVGGIGLDVICELTAEGKFQVKSIILANKTKCRLEVFNPKFDLFIPKMNGVTPKHKYYRMWLGLIDPVRPWYSEYKKPADFSDKVLDTTTIVDDDSPGVVYNTEEYTVDRKIGTMDGEDVFEKVPNKRLISSTINMNIVTLPITDLLQCGNVASYVMHKEYSSFFMKNVYVFPDELCEEVINALDSDEGIQYDKDFVYGDGEEQCRVNISKPSLETILLVVQKGDFKGVVTLATSILKITGSKDITYSLSGDGDRTNFTITVNGKIYQYAYVYKYLNIRKDIVPMMVIENE